MKKTLALTIAALTLAFPALACELEVSGAFIRATPATATTGAGFLTIRNPSKEADKLIAASATVSRKVELHTHVMDGEVMRMRAVDSIAVPAGGGAELKPGGNHIMFIDLTKPLKEGDKVAVTLKFEKCGEVKLELPVLAAGASSGPADTIHVHEHHHDTKH